MKCVPKNSARCYRVKKDKIKARSKLYQESTKIVGKSYTQQIEKLDRKVEELTGPMELLISKIEYIYINRKMAFINDTHCQNCERFITKE